MIRLEGVEKIYPAARKSSAHHALKGIDLHIEKGQVFGVIGRSGAGKSTLVRTLNRLEEATKGKVIIDGTDISTLSQSDLTQFRRQIGMVFQHFNLLSSRTVFDNVAMPLELADVPTSEIQKRVAEMLELVGLSDKADNYPSQLSGGQKQRVAIARALTLEPNILLCDEATSALDPKTTNSILNLLLEINRKIGITIIVVTHQMEVVRKVCNKVSILEHGEIASQGEVKEVFIQQPGSLKRLLGTEERSLPRSGRNIQIAHHVNELRDGELFTRMAVDLKIKYPIISGQIQEYKNDMFSLAVINVSEDQYPKVTAYLNKEGYNWREIFNDKELSDHDID